MTSSLVGSEMCIRDRTKSGSAFGRRKSSSPSFVRCAGVPQKRRGRRPVSYTHLTLPTICSV
eukprot:2580285-Prorocentrum_lima.AAC.1